MLDVHLPHGKLLGVRDFFLHLCIITIGLLIALSLEGLVEHELHRHLAREAEAGLRAEIANNEHEMGHRRQQIKDGHKQLEADVKALAEMRAHPHAKRGPMSLGYGMEGFDDMSWKTAQSTGALAYMPYKDAKAFSDIYVMQDLIFKTVMQYVDDMGNATSLFISHPDDWVPSPAQIDIETDRIGRLQFRLIVLSSEVDELDKNYKEFESEHK